MRLPNSIKQPLRRVIRWPRQSIIDLSLRETLGESIFFVQVGSNDGKEGDPLYKFIKKNKSWRGIFIEPVPYLFERLKQTYGHENRFRFLNVAISEEAGDRDFYYLARSAKGSLDLPSWFDQLGSFDANHIRKLFGSKIDPFIVHEKVRCQTLSDALCSNKVERIDLFHIDTEGYDYRVLRQLNLNRFRPKIIIYEHKHLSKEEKLAASDYLIANAYSCVEVAGDTIGVRS